MTVFVIETGKVRSKNQLFETRVCNKVLDCLMHRLYSFIVFEPGNSIYQTTSGGCDVGSPVFEGIRQSSCRSQSYLFECLRARGMHYPDKVRQQDYLLRSRYAFHYSIAFFAIDVRKTLECCPIKVFELRRQRNQSLVKFSLQIILGVFADCQTQSTRRSSLTSPKGTRLGPGPRL